MSNHSNPLIGRQVVQVSLADDRERICFHTKDGAAIIARANGDCCSNSWIESIDAPYALLGIVQTVDDLEMPLLNYQLAPHEYIRCYGCKITTTNGACVIDYRNKSNGYYGGDLVWPEPEDVKEDANDYMNNDYSWKQLAPQPT